MKSALLVDSDPPICGILQEILKSEGMDAVTLANASQAVDYARAQKFDVVFLDSSSPVSDGIELTRKIRGQEVENRVKALWVLNHQFLQLHMKDVADPPAYEALVLIGYAHVDKKYVAHWCDTYGGKFSAVGYGKRSGDAIEFEFHYPDGPFYNTFTWDAKAKRWTFRMESQNKNGKRALFAEDTLRRP